MKRETSVFTTLLIVFAVLRITKAKFNVLDVLIIVAAVVYAILVIKKRRR